MFYTYLWGAFIIELLVGLSVGWALASLYLKRKESVEKAFTDHGARDSTLNASNGSAMSGKAGVVQAIAQDRSSIQLRVQQLEKSLAESEARYEKANNELQSTRQVLAHSEATSSSLDLQIRTLNKELAERESKSVALQAQVVYFQKSAADAQTLTNTLNETISRLQSELEEAQKTHDRLNSQLSVYKEKMRVAIAQLERTGASKKMDASA